MLSKNIRSLRLKLGYTQEQIATYLNVSHSAISQYETDSRSIPVDTVAKLALLFNVDEIDLYNEDVVNQQIIFAFAFRADSVSGDDLKTIMSFKKIVLNHHHLTNALSNE